ncbi:MAG: 2Fe-2S iron-sulfur cluster-binding protein [Pigmentiphaga sp.]
MTASTSGPRRLPSGGRIDRGQPLSFRFNGCSFQGYQGDTLASALLANGVLLVGRSFKFHRPRGVMALGADEPNALVRLGDPARGEPNVKATEVVLTEGLEASSQIGWPSVRWDLGRMTDWLAPLLPAGFYYKTFMWPASFWPRYEHVIRRFAGLGRAPTQPAEDHFGHRHDHVDLLIVGGGLAGMAAARAAAASGVSIMLVETDARLGGLLCTDDSPLEGAAPDRWLEAQRQRLADLDNVRVLQRATALGRYDGNRFTIVEQLPPKPGLGHRIRQRRWMVQAKMAILATGAAERHLPFANNDLPGTMLAGAARGYVDHYAVLPGQRIVIGAHDDSAYDCAATLERAGAQSVWIAEMREHPPADWSSPLGRTQVLAGHAVIRGRGRGRVQAAELLSLRDGQRRTLACDLLLTSGGWSPRVHLSCHLGERPEWDDALAAPLPVDDDGLIAAGACRGVYKAAACLESGEEAARQALRRLGCDVPPVEARPDGALPLPPAASRPSPVVPLPRRLRGKCFVDFQTDVTTDDIEIAAREGMVSIEHLKRYTALGMGTDQGKTSGIVGAAKLAAVIDRPLKQVGTTTFRPPYIPVTLGALAGADAGQQAAPARTTPLYDWQARAGAVWMAAGQWWRAQVFPRPGETELEAVSREALNVRQAVGVTDVSTLGKFELFGPDVATLLERVYINGWQNLAAGRSRYGMMLRIDGAVFDDGTTTRLAEDHYFMTTTSGNAERVYQHLLRCLQIEWPELDVHVVPVTEQWGAFAIAGPRARVLLQGLEPDFAIDTKAFPYMSVQQGKLMGVDVRVFRISFSGELGYEVYAPARELERLWRSALECGDDLGVMPYGTEAMMVLRLEKGFVVPGFEADGRTTAADLGMGRMLSTRKEFIGSAALRVLAALPGQDRRLQLVGLEAETPDAMLPRGAQLIEPPVAGAVKGEVALLGHITSMAYSPWLRRWIGLALLENGRARHGEILLASAPASGQQARVRIVEPVFVDPKGDRANV